MDKVQTFELLEERSSPPLELEGSAQPTRDDIDMARIGKKQVLKVGWLIWPLRLWIILTILSAVSDSCRCWASAAR